MGLVQGAIRIDCDNQSAIFLAKNLAYNSKTKHIDVQYHFVKDMIEDKKVLLVKVDTMKNTTDALTQSMSFEKFSWCRETMGISGLEKRLSSPVERKQQVGDCWVVLYSFHDKICEPPFVAAIAQRRGHKGGGSPPLSGGFEEGG